MDAKEILKKIRAVFDSTTIVPPATLPPVAPTVPARLGVTYPIDGGQPAYIDSTAIEVGTAVWLDEAMTMPYPDGAYKVTDKDFAFTVAGGLVTAVEGTLDVVAAAPLVPVPMAPTLPQFEAMEAELNKLKAENTLLLERLNKLSLLAEKHEQILPQLFDLAEKLTELPVTAPKTLNDRQQEKFNYEADRDNRIDQIAKTLKKIKN